MIVVHREDNTPRLIPQTHHAAGAGQLAEQWQPPADWSSAIWSRFVQAVHHHDDGWRTLEQSPAIDEAGRPYTFKNLPTEEHVTIWRRGVDELAAEDPYQGLILALHARWLYTQVARNDDPAGEASAQQFLEWLDRRIDELMQQLKNTGGEDTAAIAPGKLDQARRLMGFFDLLSLILLGALPVNDWAEPLPFGDRSDSLRVYLPADYALALEPWPFAQPQVAITVQAYDLGQEMFASAHALGEHLRAAEPVQLQYTLVPAE
jgi:hypothetical protein